MAEPSYKHPDIEKYLDGISREAFGRSRSESIRADICVKCGKEAKKFDDQASEKEYTISGLCQVCQYGIFGGGAKLSEM